MEIMSGIFFSLFVGVAAALFAANAVITVARFTGHNDFARWLSKCIEPFASYLQLGGKSSSDRDQRSHHA